MERRGGVNYSTILSNDSLKCKTGSTKLQRRRVRSPAVALCRLYLLHQVYSALLPAMPAILRESEAQRYEIDESARVPMRDGNVLSAIVVRPRRLVGPPPAVLELTIYASEQNRTTALEAAAQGFVG